MIVVVDANIIFSALINPRSNIGKIVIERQQDLILIAPEFLKKEITKHLPRIAKYLQISTETTFDLVTDLFSIIHFYPDEIIPAEILQHAMALTDNIDQKDMIYVGFALFFHADYGLEIESLLRVLKQKDLIYL